MRRHRLLLLPTVKRSLFTSKRCVSSSVLANPSGSLNNSLSDCDWPPAAPVLPAESYITWDVEKPVKLRMGSDFPHSRPPTTVQAMFRSAAARFPDHDALAVRGRGDDKSNWVRWTYAEYLDNVLNTARAFNALGLGRFAAVGILGHNSPEWLFSSLGAIFAGGLSSGVYSTSNAETVEYLAAHAPYHVFCVDDVNELNRVTPRGKSLKEAFPDVKQFVLLNPEATVPAELKGQVMTWSELQSIGRSESNSPIDELEKNQASNQAALLSYTSGTTGPPKGVIQSHDNLTWSPFSMYRNMGYRMAEETLLSYLPPSHSASLVVDCFMQSSIAGTVYFADRDALKGKLVDNLRDVQPTLLVAVPRVLEKIEERIQDTVAQSSPIRRSLFNWAAKVARDYQERVRSSGPLIEPGLPAEMSRSPPVSKSLQYKLAHKLIYSRIHDQLGLTNVVSAPHGGLFAGAAAIRLSTHQFFEGLAVPVMEMYGATECQLQTINRPGRMHLPGSVGTEVFGTATKLLDVDENGQGEIAANARTVVMGYHKDEKRTKEAFTSDGWFRSGDLGSVDANGFYFVRSRIKEIIITSGGKNIAPVPIEAAIKEALPTVVSNAIVIGEGRKYLTCLLTLRVEPDPATMMPTDQLSPPLIKWAQRELKTTNLGKMETVQDFLQHPRIGELKDAIWMGIEKANERSEHKASKVQKFTILDKEVSVLSGELGPTLKLKRFFVHEKYKKVIDDMYEEGSEKE